MGVYELTLRPRGLAPLITAVDEGFSSDKPALDPAVKDAIQEARKRFPGNNQKAKAERRDYYLTELPRRMKDLGLTPSFMRKNL